MAVEAVIWDFGGVITSSPFEAFNRFEAERGLPKDIIRQINAANPHENAWALFERSEIGMAEFDKLFAAEARARGHEIGGAEILPLLAGDLRPDMVRALTKISDVLKTGCITNNLPANETGTPGGRNIYVKEVMALFDHVIESSKIGIRKPDPRIYKMMTDALGVDPRLCVYLDDLGINLKPAREMGMRTIKVGDPAAALRELAAATGLNLA